MTASNDPDACALLQPAGRWHVCAARGTTPATASRRRWRSAPRRSVAGRRAMRCSGSLEHAAVRRPRGARQLSRSTRTNRHHRQRQRRALCRRGRGFPQPHLCQYGREVMKQPQRMAVQIFNKTIDITATRTHPQGDQGGGKAPRGTGAEAGDQPRGPGAHGERIQRRMPAPRTIPAILNGKCTKGITPPVQLGIANRRTTVPRFAVTSGITFSFGGLRITTDGAVEDTTGSVIPACSPAANWSVACSIRTTWAARD